MKKIYWGCIGRDSNGIFLGATSRVVKATWSPVEAEAIGVKEAIIWAIKMGWQKVVVEYDAELVIAGVQGEESASPVGVIFEDINFLLKSKDNFKIVWCRRPANHVAHCIARAAVSMSGSEVSFSSPPNFIVSHLANDLLI